MFKNLYLEFVYKVPEVSCPCVPAFESSSFIIIVTALFDKIEVKRRTFDWSGSHINSHAVVSVVYSENGTEILLML
jgi:hypothetical protein